MTTYQNGAAIGGTGAGERPPAATMFSGGSAFSPGPEQAADDSARDDAGRDEQDGVPCAIEGGDEAGDGVSSARGALLGGSRDARGGLETHHRTIATEAGRYLRAVAQAEVPAYFGNHPGGGPVDDAARQVWAIAFGLAARRRFEADAPLAEIGRSAATAVHEHAASALPMLDVEMLIRDALGEPVPTGEIDPAVAAGVHLLVFASIADELALGDVELECLITEAEALAG